MPHSSGGGSHGGGSHGGGGHGGSGSSYRYSNHPFAGSTHYILYYNHGYRHYYTNEPNPKAMTKKSLRTSAKVMFLVIPICLALFFAFVSYFNPKPTKLNYGNTEVFVEDNAHVLTEDQIDSLCESLAALRDKTGVTPAIEIVTPEQSAKWYSLERMAYDEYLYFFNDEKHWLLLVEYPEVRHDSTYRNWKFEGMIGDQVEKTFNSEYENIFTKTVQKNMELYGDTDLYMALKTSYDEFTELSMKTLFEWYMPIVGFILGELIGAFLYLFVFINYKSSQKWAKAVKVASDFGSGTEIRCPECMGLYLIETTSVCPYCGHSPNDKQIY